MRVPTYAWSDPVRPVTIRISLRVVNRLALHDPNELPAGLLLGRTELHDGRHVISIDSFEPAASDRLVEVINRHPGDAVGMYRTQSNDGSLKIQLSEAVLFRHYFTRPDALFLLIHPGAGRAVFFCSEGDEFSAVHEFSFRTTEPAAEPLHRRWLFTRAQRWAIEALALVCGIVAGAALFQHFHPPPVWVPTTQEAAGHPPPEMQLPPVTARVEEEEPRPSPFATPTRTVVKPPPPAVPRPATGSPPPTSLSAAAPPPSPAVAAPPPPTVEQAPARPPSPPVATSMVDAVPSRPSEPTISVDAEPVTSSRLGNVVSRIPLLRRLNRQAETFVPPSPVRQVNPKLSSGERDEVTDPVRVSVRVYVDEEGKVQYAELLTSAKHHPKLASAAVSASRHWDFIPAAQGGQHVPGEVVLNFHFAPAPPPPASAESSQD